MFGGYNKYSTTAAIDIYQILFPAGGIIPMWWSFSRRTV